MTTLPITFTEMWSYSMLHGRQFSSWEVDVLQILDGTWFKVRIAAEKVKKDGN